MRIGNTMKGLGWALAGLLAAEAGAATTGAISPTWVEGRHPFTLALFGEGGDCAPVFSHKTSRLTAGKLVLSVLEQQRAGVACTNALSWPYRTEFDVPALDSGAYPVQVRWAQACEFDPTPCPAAYQPQDVGTLQVTDSARLAYSITPRSAPGGQAFHIRLHGNFNCGDHVLSATVDTSRPSLYLNFSIESHPEILCIAPFPGIDFAVPPLAAGVWQTYGSPYPNCPQGQICPLALRLAPQLAGALEVTPGTEAVAPLRPMPAAGPAGAGRPGFRSPWNGSYRDAIGKATRP